jgi:hypothetical protein
MKPVGRGCCAPFIFLRGENGSRRDDRADMGRSVLRPYMIATCRAIIPVE